MKCKNCSTENQSNMKICSKCGNALKKSSLGKSIAMLVIIDFVIFFLLGIIATSTGSETIGIIRIAGCVLGIVLGIPITIFIRAIKK